MRALTVAPSAVNSACGVHGRALPGGKRAIGHLSLGGVTQVGGGGAPGRSFNVDLGSVNRTLVLGNERMFASVNANAVAAPQQASKVRLGRLIMRRVPARTMEANAGAEAGRR
jgi:hypothetical protein